MALGLAFASVMFAGRASVASAKIDPGTGSSRYVAAGGWSGEVDYESGIPISAGIPHGDEQFIDPQSVEVIPYLSHGILTQDKADASAAKAIHDPFLTDVFVRQGESLGGPDGDAIAFANALESQQPTVIPYLSHGVLTQTDADALAAQTIHDPYLGSARLGVGVSAAQAIHDRYPGSALQGDESQLTVIPYLSHGVLTQADADALATGLSGDEIAFANAIAAAADSLHDPLTVAEQGSTFVPGVTDFPKPALQTAALRPDDRADRFAHSDVPPQPQMVSSDNGSTVDWSQALMVGFGALVLVLGLGLAIGYLRRPRLAGL